MQNLLAYCWKMLVSFWIKKKLNKSNNDYVGPIILAFLSFCSLFPYTSRIASQKMRPPNIFLSKLIRSHVEKGVEFSIAMQKKEKRTKKSYCGAGHPANSQVCLMQTRIIFYLVHLTCGPTWYDVCLCLTYPSWPI